MNTKRSYLILTLLVLGLSVGHTQEPSLADYTFVSEGENTYFPLRPGLTLTLEGEEEDDGGEIESLQVVIEVTEETREITLEMEGELTTIETRVVRETETVDGKLSEISHNFYAHCEETDAVYYFGEESIIGHAFY